MSFEKKIRRWTLKKGDNLKEKRKKGEIETKTEVEY
jgi:hypothetical protein